MPGVLSEKSLVAVVERTIPELNITIPTTSKTVAIVPAIIKVDFFIAGSNLVPCEKRLL